MALFYIHHLDEPSELSQGPCGHDDSTINIVLVIIIIVSCGLVAHLIYVAVSNDIWNLHIH